MMKGPTRGASPVWLHAPVPSVSRLVVPLSTSRRLARSIPNFMLPENDDPALVNFVEACEPALPGPGGRQPLPPALRSACPPP
jgi:hypothetical protein